MSWIAAWIFLLSLLGMLITYPAYFYMLNEFKVRLMRDHPRIWAGRAKGMAGSFSGNAYKALRAVRCGQLDGVPLSDGVRSAHRLATRLLYLGMCSFMALLFTGLYDAVWGAGRG